LDRGWLPQLNVEVVDILFMYYNCKYFASRLDRRVLYVPCLTCHWSEYIRSTNNGVKWEGWNIPHSSLQTKPNPFETCKTPRTTQKVPSCCVSCVFQLVLDASSCIECSSLEAILKEGGVWPVEWATRTREGVAIIFELGGATR
jgi:hypothetical protein